MRPLTQEEIDKAELDVKQIIKEAGLEGKMLVFNWNPVLNTFLTEPHLESVLKGELKSRYFSIVNRLK